MKKSRLFLFLPPVVLAAVCLWLVLAGWPGNEHDPGQGATPGGRLVKTQPAPSPVPAPSAEAVKALSVLQDAQDRNDDKFIAALTRWRQDGGELRKAAWAAVALGAAPSEGHKTRWRACLAAASLAMKKPENGKNAPPPEGLAIEALFSCTEADDPELNSRAIIALDHVDSSYPQLKLRKRLIASAERLLHEKKPERVMAGMQGLTDIQATHKADQILDAWEQNSRHTELAKKAAHCLFVAAIAVERQKLLVRNPNLSKWRLLAFSERNAKNKAKAFGQDISKWRKYWKDVDAEAAKNRDRRD